LAFTCPRCGFEAVEGTECPRCGVDVARYRAELADVSNPMPTTVDTVGFREHALTSPSARRLVVPAGFWIRFVAIAIDALILLTVQAIFAFLVWFVLRPKSPRLMAAAVGAFRLVVDSGYFIILYWLWGQTIGKMVMQIRVVRVGGGRLTVGQSALRWLGYAISGATLGIGYLMAGLRSDKRALHDLIAGTRVERVS
jgi:uncharacterized RDD family membrane protein YckC